MVAADPRLFGLATRLLIGRLHSCNELRTKLMRVQLRANARKTFAAVELATTPTPTPTNNDGDGDIDDININDSDMAAAAAATDAVIAELHSRGLLNDSEYAKWHIDQRMSPNARPRSRAQLTAELLAKRVSSDIAINAMHQHSDYDAAILAAQRKPNLTDTELKKHLRWKAFGWASIQAAISLRQEERERERDMKNKTTDTSTTKPSTGSHLT